MTLIGVLRCKRSPMYSYRDRRGPMVCLSPAISLRGSGVRVGVNKAWEQDCVNARKMPVNRARREAAVPAIGCTPCWAVLTLRVYMFLSRPFLEIHHTIKSTMNTN